MRVPRRKLRSLGPGRSPWCLEQLLGDRTGFSPLFVYILIVLVGWLQLSCPICCCWLRSYLVCFIFLLFPHIQFSSHCVHDPFPCLLVQFFPSPCEFRVSSPCCNLALGFDIVDHGWGLSFPSCAPPRADLRCLDGYYQPYCKPRLLYCLVQDFVNS